MGDEQVPGNPRPRDASGLPRHPRERRLLMTAFVARDGGAASTESPTEAWSILEKTFQDLGLPWNPAQTTQAPTTLLLPVPPGLDQRAVLADLPYRFRDRFDERRADVGHRFTVTVIVDWDGGSAAIVSESTQRILTALRGGVVYGRQRETPGSAEVIVCQPVYEELLEDCRHERYFPDGFYYRPIEGQRDGHDKTVWLWDPDLARPSVTPDDEPWVSYLDRRPPSLVRDTAANDVAWQHDAPVNRDLLHRRALADLLGGQLRRARNEHPDVSMLVHVDGPWGTGKSTLLRMLGENLTADFLIVEFNAWRHERVTPHWWPLITAWRNAVVGTGSWWRRAFMKVWETARRLRYAGGVQVTAMIVITLALALVTSLLVPSSVTGAPAFLKTGTAIITAIGVLAGAGSAVTRLLLWNSARGARLFEQSHHDPMADVAAHFDWLRDHSPKPVVVFVDDLDRCGERYVVDLLETVQNLARNTPAAATAPRRPAPHFVVTADGAWLRRAFEATYATFRGAVDRPGQPLGYLFQEKFFQLGILMPGVSRSNRESFVDQLIKGGRDRPEATDDATTGYPPNGDETTVPDHVLRRFSGDLDATPRGVKRFMNTYSVLKGLRGLEEKPVDPDTLATWVVLRTRWPELADYLETSPDTIDFYAAGSLDGATLPRPVADVITSNEFRTYFRDGPVALTGDAIRSCCGA